MNLIKNDNFFEEISSLLKFAKNNVKNYINTAMINTYFEIGKRIVEMEQAILHKAFRGEL